jgi:hypothetical protein
MTILEESAMIRIEAAPKNAAYITGAANVMSEDGWSRLLGLRET